MSNELSTTMYVRLHSTKIKFKCPTCLKVVTDIQDCVAMKLISTQEDVKIKFKKCTSCDVQMEVLSIKDN